MRDGISGIDFRCFFLLGCMKIRAGYKSRIGTRDECQKAMHQIITAL